MMNSGERERKTPRKRRGRIKKRKKKVTRKAEGGDKKKARMVQRKKSEQGFFVVLNPRETNNPKKETLIHK